MNASTRALDSVPSRILALQGGCNFRDIGGYHGAEGREVRWGRVYRTGVLSYFTEMDRDVLKPLGVRAICDLRRVEEREREPTRWPDEAVHLMHWEDGDAPMIRTFAANRPKTPAGMHDSMLDLYHALPAWMAPRIRGFLECIASGKSPVVVHCAAGKDRTGVAVAVLLHALGVSRDVIMQDYLLTNDAGDFEQFITSQHDSQLGLAVNHQPLLAMPEEIRRILFAAHADYLDAAFERIDRDYGGIDGYLSTSVQIHDDALARIREHLLTESA
ncbi:protein-tyrosine phosphatase [Povalibacter uvarum]|uniref:Protein-tyrosine phosphatase n=1 Tax=Povalibacter uvarum TaxID=732238 RepID=A0A841HJ39_9GAMM|nr:tyrosine-protein phosphatase [Povalibacter uvarum]MBB6092604.1 protein-tyrosine phosphatase [Povalibacter uvarum]